MANLLDGRLRFALGELASLPRAAVVVENPYSAVFALEHVRPSRVADALAELQVRWPTIPIVFCDNRKLAEEWTYRSLAASRAWADVEGVAAVRIGLDGEPPLAGPAEPAPSTAEVRAWARANGIAVPDRGRLRPEVHEAWRASRPDPRGGRPGP